MEDFLITIKYEFESALNVMEEERYIRDIDADIFVEPMDGSKKLIGHAKFKIVFIDQAINDAYDLFDIFDTYEYTVRHGEEIFNFENSELNKDIQKFFQFDFISSNICFLERIEILPPFRGKGLAKKIIKDIVFHYSSSCSLFVIEPFPLQFEPNRPNENLWEKQLELNNFSPKESIAFKHLSNYYQSMGFLKVPNYNNLLFYNPEHRNEKMDAINL